MTYGVGIREPLRYGFTVGRIRVLETRLLRRSHLERLLDAPSFEEQRRILSETVYGGYLEGVTSAEGVELALERALADLNRDVIGRANLPAPLLALLQARDDFNDIRGLLKAEAFGAPVGEMVSDAGSVKAEDLVAGRLPPALAEVARRVRARATDESGALDADLIDIVADAELQATIAALAEESRNRFVREVARVLADVANVKSFVRVRIRGLSALAAQRHFVAGGTLKASYFTELHRLPLHEAASRLAASGPFRDVDIDALVDLARLDVVCDAVVAKRLREAGMVAAGPEPVIAYVFARRIEIAAVRTLLIGKLAGVSRDVLRTRLRDVA